MKTLPDKVFIQLVAEHNSTDGYYFNTYDGEDQLVDGEVVGVYELTKIVKVKRTTTTKLMTASAKDIANAHS